MNKELMVGIDLHSNNMMCGVVAQDGRRVFRRKLPCALPAVLSTLEPFRHRIVKIAVESTFNWYWLVDGLSDAGYEVVLAHPPALTQYEGIKHTDDQHDAFFLAELLRLNILHTGHICDRRIRPVRDLLRRRLALVQKRTSLYLSFKALHMRMIGQSLSLSRVKSMEAEEAAALYSHTADQMIAQVQLHLAGELTEAINKIEREVQASTTPLPAYHVLQTLPGVGKILGLTITLETGDINRFPTAGDYASYSRCVDSKRLSNGKKKGTNNVRCGNHYLSWAWVEAANFAKRFNDRCRQFYDRKRAQANCSVAIKALACKLAKAAWYMMRDNKPYDPRGMFPSVPKSFCCLGMGDKTISDSDAQPCDSPD